METPGYFYKSIPANQSQMTIDIVLQVWDRLSGAEMNHGLLFTGGNEFFAKNNEECVSYYSASCTSNSARLSD
jgi:hypothetical protein